MKNGRGATEKERGTRNGGTELATDRLPSIGKHGGGFRSVLSVWRHGSWGSIGGSIGGGTWEEGMLK